MIDPSTFRTIGAMVLGVAVGLAAGLYLTERLSLWLLLSTFAAYGACFAAALLAMDWKNRHELAELDRLLEKRNADWRPPHGT